MFARFCQKQKLGNTKKYSLFEKDPLYRLLLVLC